VHTCNTGLSVCTSINRSDGEYCKSCGVVACTPYTLRTPSKLPRIMLSSPAPNKSATAKASHPKVSPRPHTVDQQSRTLNNDIRPTMVTKIIYNIIIYFLSYKTTRACFLYFSTLFSSSSSWLLTLRRYFNTAIIL